MSCLLSACVASPDSSNQQGVAPTYTQGYIQNNVQSNVANNTQSYIPTQSIVTEITTEIPTQNVPSVETVNILNYLSEPIADRDSVHALSGDLHIYSGNSNFRIGYNSANGMYLMWAAKNISDKAIKYIRFTVEFFNPVDDPAYDSITNDTKKTIELIGPIAAGDSFLYRKIIAYSNSCEYVNITKIEIDYMDGTTVTGMYNYSTKGQISTSDFSGTPEIYVSRNIG